MKKGFFLVFLIILMFSPAFAQTRSSTSSDEKVEVVWESNVSIVRPWINARIVNDNDYDITVILDIIFSNGNTRSMEVNCPANDYYRFPIRSITSQISNIKITYTRSKV